MRSRVMVTGVPGVGKTTVLKQDIINDPYEVLEFGEKMFEVGEARGVISDKGDIAKLAINSRLELQTAVTGQIVASSSKRPLVIDGHLLVASTGGFAPGLPEACIYMLSLTAVVFLEAKEDDIVKRRHDKIDKYEKTPLWDNREHVSLHQNLARSASLTYALKSEASFTVIRNEQGEQLKTAQMLKTYLDTITKT